jgi:succinylarginine dihydrolase
MTAVEVNFDGLVGPTHHYGGLGQGNLASARHSGDASNPQAAALEGLAKMRQMLQLGLAQGVFPPQERPNIAVLRSLGFDGPDQQVVEQAAEADLDLLSAVSSASSMWTANAATVSPSSDTRDGRVHFTSANLASHLHRSIEASDTSALLKRVFPDPKLFAHHSPLPSNAQSGDEGAANHSRLTPEHSSRGVELFVYGTEPGESQTSVYPPRQSLLASQAIARNHGLRPEHTVMARQSQIALDGGVFHNDVIAVADRDLLVYHEDAFARPDEVLGELANKMSSRLLAFKVLRDDLPLEDAVTSYLFNSQLVQTPTGSRILVAPTDAKENPRANAVIDGLTGDAFDQVIFMNLRQSMRNGGGPACLRLRVVLTPTELAQVHHGCLVTDDLLAQLEAWVRKHYRTELCIQDLADPGLLQETRAALDHLSHLLDLPNLYAFQQ